MKFQHLYDPLLDVPPYMFEAEDLDAAVTEVTQSIIAMDESASTSVREGCRTDLNVVLIVSVEDGIEQIDIIRARP